MIEKEGYLREHCPHCRSINLDDVRVIFVETECPRTLCRNCYRIFFRWKVKRIYDRAAMRRDHTRLGKFLTEKAVVK